MCVKVISEEQGNRVRTLSNNTGAPEDIKDGNKKDGDDSGFTDNAIDIEMAVRRKMERTTIKIRNYPLVTEATPPLVTANSVSEDPKHVAGLSTLAIFSPSATDYPRADDLDFRTGTTLSLNLRPSLSSNQHQTWEVIQQLSVKKLATVPSFISGSAPVALPIPLRNSETLHGPSDALLRNSGTSASMSGGHFFNLTSASVRSKDDAFEQRQLPRLDDILGCTWDIVTNSCKDLFSLKLCSHCHDFGNIFLRNCKCLVKYKTTF